MKTKLFTTLIATAFITGCASTSSHQYNDLQSYAWNLSQAAEMGDVMKDDIPTNEMVKGWGLIGNTGYAAIQSGFSFGSLFGLHMIGAMAIDSNKNKYVQQRLMVMPMDTEGKTEKDVGLEISNKIASGIVRASPDTSISNLSHKGFTATGPSCDVAKEYHNSVNSPQVNAIEKLGCRVFLSTNILSDNTFLPADNPDTQIVRTRISGSYPFSLYAHHIDDVYFYFPSFLVNGKPTHPASFVKNSEAFLFFKPENNIEFKADASSVIPYYKEHKLF